MTRSLLLAPLAIAVVSAATLTERQSSCACGYQDSTGAVWRESFVSDFTAVAGWSPALSANFDVFDYPESHDGSPKTMKYTTANVYGYNYGLGMKTSAYTSGPSSTDPVLTAGIRSKRHDILYGTFRMRATVPSVPGVCFGFFTYKDPSYTNQEADVEFLSSDEYYYQTVHQTNHPGLVNGNTDTAAYKKITVEGADFTAFNEHRLDWHPGFTKYYLNAGLKSTISKNSPTLNSSLILNVWSDGLAGWSQGPPTSDAIATVYYVKAYFNSTSVSEIQFNSNCGGSTPPCLV